MIRKHLLTKIAELNAGKMGGNMILQISFWFSFRCEKIAQLLASNSFVSQFY